MQLTSLSLALTRAGFLSFTPASLFAAGEQGAWYDPSDISTLFTDSAGTTLVTAVEQPVGLVLDKSKGLVLGSELVTNGDFSNGTTGWTGVASTLAAVSGQLEVNITGSNGGVQQPITCSVGKWYILSYYIRKGTFDGTQIATVASNGLPASTITLNSAGETQRLIFLATDSTVLLRWARTTANTGTVYFDNISVRELPGNHAYQSTSASRPVLSARVNLLTKTEQFDDGAWAKSNTTVTPNAVVAPDGTITADKVIENTAVTVAHTVTQNVQVEAATYVASVYAKAAERTKFRVRRVSVNTLSFTVTFDLIAGTATATGSTVTITPVGDGWFRCSFTMTHTVASVGGFYVELADASGAVTYTGDGTSGIYIWGADLRVANTGVNLPAYQRVNTATDYATEGFPKYLKFDGVDDFLVTNSINFTTTDKVTVWTGARKFTDAASGILAELSANSDITNGTFAIYYRTASRWTFSSRGTAQSGTNASPFAVPITNVLTGIGDIAADNSTIRVNGSPTTSAVDQGTGNYIADVLYIGRRGGTMLPFNGHLYGLIVRGAQTDAGGIANTEKYMNTLTKAF